MKIEARGLCKRFSRIKNSTDKKSGRREEFLAVDHVDLDTAEGEIVGVLGPNGAGKTTLLRMLGRLMSPSEGTVRLFDDEGKVIEDPIRIKSLTGYLSENTRLYGRFSTRELLHTLAEIHGISREEEEERVERISEVLGMRDFIDNRIERLSTGQTQRANIARCLIHSPGIYIFDEPTLGLDILSSEAIVSFMKSERDLGKSVLYSTHYMEEAQYLCDRVVMIYQGRIIADAPTDKLMADTGTDNLRESFRALIAGRDGEGDA